jgi:hypothetical protein
MTTDDRYYIVVTADWRERDLGGIPTPMLTSLGTAEAWQEDPGIWRARDDRHDPPGTVYTRVRVIRNPAVQR